MELNFMFFINSILLGAGLAMDAFSVSLANGLNEPEMRKRKMCCVAGVFALFQAIMPIIGWVCVHTVVERFKAFERFVPYIALILLAFIGSKMIYEGIKNPEENSDKSRIGPAALLLQGVATSIDALSVGFTIAEYDILKALICAALIAAVTFIICICGIVIGSKAGTKYSSKASVLGGVILIVIGIEIFIKGIFGINIF